MRSNQDVDRLSEEVFAARDVQAWCRLFHPTDSVYIDPVFGEFRTRDQISRWLVRAMRRAGQWSSTRAGARYFDGNIAFGESVLTVDVSGGEKLPIPFCWVQRYQNGWIVYRRDYYDSTRLRMQVPRQALQYTPTLSPDIAASAPGGEGEGG